MTDRPRSTVVGKPQPRPSGLRVGESSARIKSQPHVVARAKASFAAPVLALGVVRVVSLTIYHRCTYRPRRQRTDDSCHFAVT